MKAHDVRGFSLVELIVSVAIMVAVLAGVFHVVNPAYGIFETELERIDMQQRARVSADALVRDLIVAGAGASTPPVAPYRRGTSADPPGAVFADRISVAYTLPGSTPVIATYTTRTDASGVSHLMRYDGDASDLPVVDYVSGFDADYFDAAQRIGLDRFGDGPWVPDAVSLGRYDADLLSVRRIRLCFTIRPARALLSGRVADHRFCVDVAPRNLNLP